LDQFGKQKVGGSFFHTGLWQAWGPEGKTVYYQAGGGDQLRPRMAMRELDTGREYVMDGDMEGAPLFGEPIISCLHGMLYAAGYGDRQYRPEQSPVPFQNRDDHGLFQYQPRIGKAELVMSVNEILASHPDRILLQQEDEKIKKRNGGQDGLTLMAYCARYSRDGERILFHFGNHCVVSEREEPKIMYLFTCDINLKNIRMVLDISFDKRGVHWSWQPDGEHLIGYGPIPGQPGRSSLMEIKYDGTGYHALSDHNSGGHPSVSPADRNLIVTDASLPDNRGEVVLIDRRTGQATDHIILPKRSDEGQGIPPGRNRHWVCHHPVFNRDGTRILANMLPDRLSRLCEITL
jgi:hypothetical protein